MILNPKTNEAFSLLMNGILALARVEQQGLRVDVEYIENKKVHLTRKIERLENQFKETKLFRHWQHTVGGNININSNAQLSNYLYKIKKVKVQKETYSGAGSTDEEALKAMNIPELETLLQMRKLKKLRDTYLDALAREQVNGCVHPFFNLHLAASYRSCIAKGTLILAVRDFLKYPKGVPIEEIKEGDYLYCFDDNLNPTITKVIWAGKTGYKEVVRIHYSVQGGHANGYLDVTPEHRIRLIDGSYEQAQNLVGDFRKSWESKKLQKIRTLSCARVDDKLNFTGCIKNGKGILEHRFIYEQLIGELLEEERVHHKNEIHLDHIPSNLEKMSASKHASLHSKTTIRSPKGIRNNKIAIQKAKKNGVYKRAARRGIDTYNYLGLSKYTCYRLLAEVAGHLTKINYDFNTFKKYLKLYDIDYVQIMMRYDKYGNYIWKIKLKELSKLGRPTVSEILGHNYYKLLDLYNFYDVDTKRKWGNQFGNFVLGNHNITKIEWIKKTVDVYDIEVDEFNNFFANEICVHNSSDHPNLQNIPKRDEESMQLIRQAIYPRPNHQFLEIDFKGIEIAINACYNKDPNLIKYIKNPASDMHADMAKQIFIVDKFDKNIPEHYVLRQAAKNGFVFPEFYGDYYINCAENMVCGWGNLPKGRWSEGQGIEVDGKFLSDHLISKGITSLKKFEEHLKKIEKDFWGNRFPEYAQWKERWWSLYKKYGYIDTYVGFRYSGVMDRKQVISYPGQGTAFHCLLWSLIQIDDIIQKEKLDTKIVNQIHDSILFDTNPDELSYIIKIAKDITANKLPEFWKWICVPMSVDLEIAPVDRPWNEKSKFDENSF